MSMIVLVLVLVLVSVPGGVLLLTLRWMIDLMRRMRGMRIGMDKVASRRKWIFFLAGDGVRMAP